MLAVTCSESDTANPSKSSQFENERILTDSLEGISLNSNDSTAPRTSPSWTRSDLFYFTLVTFRAGSELFRVPRDRFETNSTFFRDMFAMNKDVPGPHEGDSDDNPIYLEGVQEGAFRSFLPRPPVLWRPRWIDVLHLSHMWKFGDIQKLAISQLKCFLFNEISNVELVHKYGIEEWRMSSYIALAKRSQSLSVEEAERLGLHFAIRMAQVRERRIRRKDDADPEDKLLRNDIEELIG